MNINEEELLKTAGELAGELATMHGVLFNLLLSLRHTELSDFQATLIRAAMKELQSSQQRFFAKYADMVGGAVPERN